MLKPRAANPTLTSRVHEVSEVYLELDTQELRMVLGEAEFLLIRVQTRGPSGRPASKTMRLHKDQLLEPVIPGSDPWLDS